MVEVEGVRGTQASVNANICEAKPGQIYRVSMTIVLVSSEVKAAGVLCKAPRSLLQCG